MNPPLVLVIRKKNTRPPRPAPGRRDSGEGRKFLRRTAARMRRADAAQRAALRAVLAVLRRRGFHPVVADRSAILRRRRFDLAVSVGGDGTFLEMARAARAEQVVGVNADPKRSAGSFCSATAATFERILGRILLGQEEVLPLHRFQVVRNGRPIGPPVLNEILVTHRKPAAMSRYWVRIGSRWEEQRSSGLWIATAAGSTGAIRSAGGRVLPRGAGDLQYRPRELYGAGRKNYRLSGGVIRAGTAVWVGSLMKQGMVCLDGEHVALPFRYGDSLEIRPCPDPLRWVVG